MRNGTLWDDPKVCDAMLAANKAAHKRLIRAVKRLYDDLNEEGLLKKHLRRKLLIFSFLIAYLEERGVFPAEYFSRFMPGAQKYFQVLADGSALVALLGDLEERFNGHVFLLEDRDADALRGNGQLQRFSRLIEGRQEESGQRTLWELYSFKDLPVELVSHIYQLFVEDSATSVYTPPFVVRLLLDEALSWDSLDRLHEKNQIILDPCCGSGIFLVEAYKRLVLHWRSRNGWARPSVSVLKKLTNKVHGIDLEEGAVELAAFSLCLALCDALEPETIRSSIKLFPPLAGRPLRQACFFEAKELRFIKEPIGIVVGNPPFTSSLRTPGAQRSYETYKAEHGSLPDKQLAYLFLHEAMTMLADGGILSMLQQYNFLYNQQSIEFRRSFIARWDVREILDFISVRGLFQKGGADTKALAIVACASQPREDRKVLHATFRRTGRIDAEQGFDIDYYDLHWVSRHTALSNDDVWRANLLGGARVLSFVTRLRDFRTLGKYAEDQDWDCGEGFIEGRRGVSGNAEHLTGQPLLPSNALTESGIDASAITKVEDRPIEGPRSRKRFTPPMLLIREHMNLLHGLWSKHYLTYKNEIVGFAAPKSDQNKLVAVDRWLTEEAKTLRAYASAISVRLFTLKATALASADIMALPFPETPTLDISANEKIVVEDIVQYQRDLIRLGADAKVMRSCERPVIDAFAHVFSQQINAIYKRVPLRPLDPQFGPGIICLPLGSMYVTKQANEPIKASETDARNDSGVAIEVTPEMAAAGFRALVAFGPADEADDVTLAEVFRAMLRSAPRCYREEWSRSL